MQIKSIVLAAGKGTRLQTEGITLPKVMRLAAGKPLLAYVLDALSFLPKEDTILVVGYRKEDVQRAYPRLPYRTANRTVGHRPCRSMRRIRAEWLYRKRAGVLR